MKNYTVEKPNHTLAETGIELFRSDNQPGPLFTTFAHIHEAVELIIIKKGVYKMTEGDREYVASDGDVVLFRSNSIHSIYLQSESEGNYYYVLKFDPSLIYSVSDSSALKYIFQFVINEKESKYRWTPDELRAIGAEDAINDLITTLEGDSICRDMARKISIYRVIYTFLCDLMPEKENIGEEQEPTDSVSALIYRTIRKINKSYSEALTAELCAKEVGMSYSYFSRSFKRITSKSFKEYLNEVRINNAERLLLSSDSSVTEIALECGYTNPSYFISVYRAAKGLTPKARRLLIKNGE